jgi:hypothetical protein
VVGLKYIRGRKKVNESAIVLYGKKLIAATIGNPVSVEFPFEKIWDFKKKCPLFNPAYLRFYHTHPNGFSEYSETDVNCLKGLNLAFDFPVYFSILYKELNEYGYHQISYVYYKRMVEVEDIPLLKPHLFLLNSLSRGDIVFHGDK